MLKVSCSLLAALLLNLNTQAQASDFRKLTFNCEHSVGRIYLLKNDWSAAASSIAIDRQAPLYEAKGQVTLPAQRACVLIGNSNLAGHMEALHDLKAADLACLDLSKLELNSDQIFQISHLTGLQRLQLEESDVDDSCFSALSSLTNLEYLNLSKTLIKGQEIRKLAALKKLKRLYLSNNKLDPEAVEQLSQFKQLTSLHLNGCGITSSALSKLTKLTNLTDLALACNAHIDDRAMDALTEFKHLRWLSLGETAVSSKGLKKLSSLKPAAISFSMQGLTLNQLQELHKTLPRTNFEDINRGRMDPSIFNPLH